MFWSFDIENRNITVLRGSRKVLRHKQGEQWSHCRQTSADDSNIDFNCGQGCMSWVVERYVSRVRDVIERIEPNDGD
jgi:hypothetical protein